MSDRASSELPVKEGQVYSLAQKRRAALAEIDNASFKYVKSIFCQSLKVLNI